MSGEPIIVIPSPLNPRRTPISFDPSFPYKNIYETKIGVSPGKPRMSPLRTMNAAMTRTKAKPAHLLPRGGDNKMAVAKYPYI